MENGEFAIAAARTDREDCANKAEVADHLLTTDRSMAFPEPDDWEGWIDVWCRDDDGTIECVPDCLRTDYLMTFVGANGRLADPDLVPDSPYKLARWLQIGGSNPQPPWIGMGATPSLVKREWNRIVNGVEPDPEPEAIEPVVAAKPEGSADLYMIGSEGGPIKIGISVNPRHRLRQLQTAHPHRLQLLCIVPGGCELEGMYHAQFAAHRLHGEWFAPHPDILAEIERLSPTASPGRAG